MASLGSVLGSKKKDGDSGKGNGDEGLMGSLGSLFGSKKGDGKGGDEKKEGDDGKEKGGLLGSLGSLLGSSKKEGEEGKKTEGSSSDEGGEGKKKEEGILGSLGSLLGSKKEGEENKEANAGAAAGGLDTAALNGALAKLSNSNEHDPKFNLVGDSIGLATDGLVAANDIIRATKKTGTAFIKATFSKEAREDVDELLTSVEDISQGKSSGNDYVDVGLKMWDTASSMLGDVKDMMFDTACAVMTQLLCNNSVEDAIGVVLFFAMYLYGWLRGFAQSSGSCDSAGRCRPEYVLFSMLVAMVEVWMYVVVGVMSLVIIDKLFIQTLFMSNDGWSLPDASITIGVRIAFSWILNSRLLIALGVAWGVTFGFAFVYLKWIQLRGSKGEERRLAVRNVYMFNLGMVLMVLVLQMWIDWWWKKG